MMGQDDITVIDIAITITSGIAVEVARHNRAADNLYYIKLMTTKTAEYDWVVHDFYVTMRQLFTVELFFYCNLTAGLVTNGKIHISCLWYKLVNLVREYRCSIT